jgi:hypothetical protein
MISYIIYDINMIPLTPSPPSCSSARPSSVYEPAAAPGGGRVVVLSPLPQLAPHPAETAAGSVPHPAETAAGSVRNRRRQHPAGGEGLCSRICRSSRLTLRKQRRGQCGQQHQDKVRRAAGSSRLTWSVAFLRIRRACSGEMPRSARCSGVIAST